MSYNDLPISFRQHVQVNDLTGCWEWVGGKTGGYGGIKIDGEQKRAHIVAYEAENGPVPDGLLLDHLCRNRACVRPSHLEAVTHLENCLRGVAARPERTHCRRGHALEGANLYVNPKGGKVCKTCRNAANARRTSSPKRSKDVCRKGHPRTEENTYTDPSGNRYCRVCTRARKRVRPVKTHCPHGHALEGKNLYIAKSGSKVCKKCRAIWIATRREQAKWESLD